MVKTQQFQLKYLPVAIGAIVLMELVQLSSAEIFFDPENLSDAGHVALGPVFVLRFRRNFIRCFSTDTNSFYFQF